MTTSRLRTAFGIAAAALLAPTAAYAHTTRFQNLGGSVVVDALGDSILDLTVLEVRLVPAITSAK